MKAERYPIAHQTYSKYLPKLVTAYLPVPAENNNDGKRHCAQDETCDDERERGDHGHDHFADHVHASPDGSRG